MSEAGNAKGGRLAVISGLSAVAGVVVTVVITVIAGAFNLNVTYRLNQATLENINAHISSLEKNYDLLNTAVQDDRQAGRQISSVQSDVLRLAQSIQENSRTMTDLATELSHVRETAARVDERVLLLDKIIERVKMRVGP